MLRNVRFLVLGVWLMTAGAAAASDFRQVVRFADPTPTGNGVFVSFDSPYTINDAGQAMFSAQLAGTMGGTSDNRGNFVGDGSVTTEIVRLEDPAPDGNGAFSLLPGSAFLNNHGQTGFVGWLDGVSGGYGQNHALFRGSGGALTRIVRSGDTSPDSDGRFFGVSEARGINDSGAVAFQGTLDQTSLGGSNNTGLYRGDGTALVQLAREHALVPEGNGRFSSFSFAGPNDYLTNSGKLVFQADLREAPAGTSSGIYVSDGSTVTNIIREGSPAPGGGVHGQAAGTYLIHENDHVSVTSLVSGTPGGATDGSAFFRHDGTSLSRVIGSGDVLSGVGTLTSVIVSQGSDNGHVALRTQAQIPGFTLPRNVLAQYDGASVFEIAREGDTVPGGNGMFVLGGNAVSVNDAGQMAFYSSIIGTMGGSQDDAGIFFYDNVLGIIPIIREGDKLFGETVLSLEFDGLNPTGQGLSNIGEVVFHYSTLGGTRLAIWTVPEPASLAAMLLGMSLLGRRRRKGDLCVRS